MPHAFTPTQYAHIRQKLISAARIKIRETGVRKTSVETLTDAANISTGAFYRFFPSKETLFFCVYEELETDVKKEFMDLLENVETANRDSLKQAILTVLRSETTRHLVTVLRHDELDYLITKLEPEIIFRHIQSDQAYLQQVLDLLAARGFTSNATPDLVIEYIQSIFLILYGQDHLPNHSDRIISAFIQTMVNDLFIG